MEKYTFYKNKDTDKVYWVDNGTIGTLLISFDKEKVFNLFTDYPGNLTTSQVAQFDKENPEWANFFADRKE